MLKSLIQNEFQTELEFSFITLDVVEIVNARYLILCFWVTRMKHFFLCFEKTLFT